MSRNKYDSSTGTLTPIGGWQGVDNALSASSHNPVQNSVLTEVINKTYKDDDSAETTLADGDYLPFYDTSDSAKKRMLLSTARNDVRKRIAESVSNDVIETLGGTALKSYLVGQYFLANDGYYYVATSAITAGTSNISAGTSGNCTRTSIAAGMNTLASQISNLMNSVTPQSFTMTPNASYIDSVGSQQNYSVGRICFISVTGLRFKAIPDAETAIFTDAPIGLQYVSGRAFAGDGTGFRITNGSSGKILTSTVPGSTSIAYSFTLVYIII